MALDLYIWESRCSRNNIRRLELNQEIPWLIIGYFNICNLSFDKWGGRCMMGPLLELIMISCLILIGMKWFFLAKGILGPTNKRREQEL